MVDFYTRQVCRNLDIFCNMDNTQYTININSNPIEQSIVQYRLAKKLCGQDD